jgi:hypothetical protein
MPYQSLFIPFGVDTKRLRSYLFPVVAKSTAWDWHPGNKGGHDRRKSGFFVSKKAHVRRYGRAVWSSLRAHRFLCTGMPARTVRPPNLAFGLGVKEPIQRTMNMNAPSLKRYRAISTHTRNTHTVLAHSFAGAAALLPADAAIICRTPVTRQIAQEVAA